MNWEEEYRFVVKENELSEYGGEGWEFITEGKECFVFFLEIWA